MIKKLFTDRRTPSSPWQARHNPLLPDRRSGNRSGAAETRGRPHPELPSIQSCHTLDPALPRREYSCGTFSLRNLVTVVWGASASWSPQHHNASSPRQKTKTTLWLTERKQQQAVFTEGELFDLKTSFLIWTQTQILDMIFFAYHCFFPPSPKKDPVDK